MKRNASNNDNDDNDDDSCNTIVVTLEPAKKPKNNNMLTLLSPEIFQPLHQQNQCGKRLAIPLALKPYSSSFNNNNGICISKDNYLGGAYFVARKHIQPQDLEPLTIIKEQMYGKKKAVQETYLLYDDTDKYFVGVPRYYGIQKYGMVPPENDYTVIQHHNNNGANSHVRVNLQFKGTLLSSPVPQKLGVDTMVRHFLNPATQNGGVLVCPCGGGKTCMAVAIMCELKLRAGVIVQDNEIAKQWVNTLKTFCPTAKVGFAQGSTNDFGSDDVDVVIIMAQSLSSHTYTISDLKKIHFLIIDEFHHYSADTRAMAVRKIPAKYTLGLSATPYRADGLHYHLPWLIGPTVIILKKEPMPVHVKMLQYTHSNQPSPVDKNNTPLFQRFYGILAKDYVRLKAVVTHVLKLMQEQPKRRYLVWAKQIMHLINFKNVFMDELALYYEKKQTLLEKTTGSVRQLLTSNAAIQKDNVVATTATSKYIIIDNDDDANDVINNNNNNNNNINNNNNDNDDDDNDDDDANVDVTDFCINSLGKKKKKMKICYSVAKQNSTYDTVNIWKKDSSDVITSFGFIIGQASDKQKEDAMNAHFLLGSNKLEEGFDDKKRDTLIVLDPHSKELDQLVGRLQRVYPDKESLLVLHVHDMWFFAQGMGYGCIKKYKSLPLFKVTTEPLLSSQ